MELTHQRRTEKAARHPVRAGLKSCEAIRKAVLRNKQSVLNEYLTEAGEHARVLRLALTEAEALAWQTDFPDLLFPTLATEKARAAVLWHQRQRALRRTPEERDFAE
jgi:hypothetical protein